MRSFCLTLIFAGFLGFGFQSQADENLDLYTSFTVKKCVYTENSSSCALVPGSSFGFEQTTITLTSCNAEGTGCKGTWVAPTVTVEGIQFKAYFYVVSESGNWYGGTLTTYRNGDYPPPYMGIQFSNKIVPKTFFSGAGVKSPSDENTIYIPAVAIKNVE